MSFLSKLWKSVVRPVAKAVIPGYAQADAIVSGITRASKGGGELGSTQQAWAPVLGAAGRAALPVIVKKGVPIVRRALTPATKPKGAVIPRPASPGIGNRPVTRPMLGVDANGRKKAPPKKKAPCCNPCKPAAKKRAAPKKGKSRRAAAAPRAKGISAAELKAYRRLEPMIARMSNRTKVAAVTKTTSTRARS